MKFKRKREPDEAEIRLKAEIIESVSRLGKITYRELIADLDRKGIKIAINPDLDNWDNVVIGPPKEPKK